MSLEAGTTLGPYEILSPIGAGGMGEVYKARDTRLDRTVAIKVLPEHVASDPDLKQRFEREARTVAALNHPHICTLHDIGSQDGVDFLVMEYLEGQTVAQRLEKGALPLDQALQIAIDMADALDKAHRQGIVHRDLKPANIMLTKAGAKLLDFGLAKLKPPDQAGGLSALPTQPADLTQQGAILGTFQYMAPEQLEGQEADARTDIFAFGTVVYEMVTGRKAFEGKSQASLISAIMTAEPPAIASMQPMSPPALDHAVRTCLAKDPDLRWQTAGDVGRQLQWVTEGGSQVAMPAVVAVHRRRKKAVLAAALGGLVGMVVAGLAVWAVTRPVAPTPQRVSVVLPSDRSMEFGWTPGSSLDISPDGTHIVYTGRNPDAAPGDDRRQLYVRSLAERSIRLLPGTEGGKQPFFSPNGEWVAFFTEDHALKKVALAGGRSVTLMEGIEGGRWGFGSWVDDDSIVFGAGATPLRRISADGGTPHDLTSLELDERSHGKPDLVPESRAVLFHSSDVSGNYRIEAVSLDSGERRVVAEDARKPRYLASGHLLFRRHEVNLIAPFDPNALSLTGSAFPFVDEVRHDGPPLVGGSVPQLAVSGTGTLAYVPGSETEGGTLGWVSREGTFEPVGPPPNRFDRTRVSPSGRYVAFEIQAGGEGSEVHIYDTHRGTTNRLTRAGSDQWPAWHPDGRGVAVWSRGDARGIYLKDLTGADRLLVKGDDLAQFRPGSWSPDGALLAYTVQFADRHDIWVLSVTDSGDPTTEPYLATPAEEHSPKFSPDGRWLAYVSTESGRHEVYIREYPDGAAVPVSTEGGTGPVWSSDGKEIFFISYPGSQRLYVVSVVTGRDGLRLGEPVRAIDMRVTGPAGVQEQYRGGSNWGPRYDTSPDGRFLMVRGPTQQDEREIVLVQNWFEELKERVPID